MDVVIEGPHGRVGIGKLVSSIRIFVPFALETIQTIKELWIVDMDFVRANPDNRT